MIESINQSFAIFRDDLFPLLGGGNKARKMMALHNTIQEGQHTSIVTTGGIQSNHCRATALYCSKYDLDCTLVLHGNKEKFLTENGNARLIRNTNANVVFCNSDEISLEMDKAMLNYKALGQKPFYLYGGGHTLEGGKAYIDIIEEIKKSGFAPDYIFLASGTGSTQAGLLAGISKYQLKTKVIGISVGREKKRSEKIIKEFYSELCYRYSIPENVNNITVADEFLCGGYEKFNDEILQISNNSYTKYGIPLDTTYTAKAFYGMQQIIKKQMITGNILFWNTGGIFNYFN
ncbi:D-cysteine desulfhydrase [Arenibacter palladensis]|uniref:D-cysteine desulfhydrase n=1 Tax=Arenibacter palladensis TaxID=237373 RepID=A0A1M5EKE7_9FLAO|nr:pyridoxal-phosphate dependent enzyme [Arenibacter palladensis]SHF79685.1 D-cysteine desulfhydrase [Arenibacter palladensis]